MSFKHAVLSPAAAASRSSELRIFLNFLLTTNSPRSTDTEARGEPLRRGEALRADAGREGCAAEVGTLVEEEEDASGNDPEAAAAACGDGDGVRAAGVDGFFAADEGGGLLMRAWTVRAAPPDWKSLQGEGMSKRRSVLSCRSVKRTSDYRIRCEDRRHMFRVVLAGRYLTCRFN